MSGIENYEGQPLSDDKSRKNRKYEVDAENERASISGGTEIKKEESRSGELGDGSDTQPTDTEVGVVVTRLTNLDGTQF